MSKDNVFRIGIAMAGAVSAGAYTAGVIDYLLEALQRWEEAKQINRRALQPDATEEEKTRYDESVPMHDVVIDVFGGASAGGMTSAITTLALFEGIKPVNDENKTRAGNKLYDSWVKLNDHTGKGKTLVQMLQTTDIQANKVPSLLNSTAIDEIANRAKDIRLNYTFDKNWPPYISQNLELILTICSLRGIPVEIDFAGDSTERLTPDPDEDRGQPAHKMFLHKGMAHFTLTPGNREDHLLNLDPTNQGDKDNLIECAKATGAFPIGLMPQNLKVTRPYLKAQLKRLFDQDIEIRWDKIPPLFEFTAIDGGTINNEPFDEVLKVLEERFEADCKSSGKDPDQAFRNYALIMIDPFPNFEEGEEEDYKGPQKITEAAPLIISAIRRQAMMKESEISKGFLHETTRAMIFPVRRKMVEKDGQMVEEKQPYAIACGSLDGFGGFFSEGFREHDFFLGRKNCQSFLRKHFSLREEDILKTNSENEKIDFQPFAEWKKNTKMFERFHYKKGDKNVFPIIPDLRIIQATSKDPEKNGTLPNPELHKITLEELQELKKPMKKRVDTVFLSILKDSVFPSAKKKTDPEEEKLQKEVRKFVNRHLSNTTLIRILKYFIGFILGIILLVLSPILVLLLLVSRYLIVNMVTNQIFRSVVYDFKKRDLLD